ncbi:MAG TPA: DUF3224 domain-containing protein [Acidimicrobiales bacterium]|jgi:hypothetical protein
MATAVGGFELTSWNETPYGDDDGNSDGTRLTRAEVRQRFEGDVEGEGDAVWLMSYRPDGTARFVGLQRVTGTIGGKRGSAVLETIGDFDGQVAEWRATVVRGTGTGQLEGLRGDGSFDAPHGSRASFTLEYDFA